MGHSTQSSTSLHSNMKVLLVCSVLALSSADPQLFLGGGYPYHLGAPLTYTPHIIKPVLKEIGVPVKTITYGIKETGCENNFGFPVPCFVEGGARRKRAVEEEAEVKAAPAPLLPYAAGIPLGYGYGYGLGLPYPYAAPAVTVAEPKVTEVEVPHYVYKAVNEKVELPPLCHNGWGFAVPCA